MDDEGVDATETYEPAVDAHLRGDLITAESYTGRRRTQVTSMRLSSWSTHEE